jgi:hypothetical protein
MNKEGTARTVLALLCVLLIFGIGITVFITKPVSAQDNEVEFVTDNLVFIEENDWGMKVMYDKDTQIVYIGNFANYASYLSPYLMTNEKGEICGAVWANGKITPAPFAVGSP